MAKKTKQDKRRQRQERQEAERRAERRRNLITLGIVAGIVVIGGVLVWASLGDESDPLQDLENLDPEDIEDLDPEDLEGLEGLEDPAGSEGSEGSGESDGSGEADGEGDGSDASDEETGSKRGDRPIACGAQEPAAADEDKSTFDEPGDALAGVEAAQAHMMTSCGEIVLNLDLERAPEISNSFAFLAEEGFYDGLEFFRSRSGLDMVQSGSGNNSSTWDVGYTLPAELAAAEDEGYPPGAVALAVPEGAPDEGGSQFFIVYGDAFMDAVAAGALPSEYPRFATVTHGLDVVERIGDIEVEGPNNDRPTQRVYIESVEIEAA